MPLQILDLFPLEEAASKDTAGDTKVDSTLKHVERMTKSLVLQKPIPLRDGESPAIQRAGNAYRYYRSVEGLSGKAKTFYDKVGKPEYFDYDRRS